MSDDIVMADRGADGCSIDVLIVYEIPGSESLGSSQVVLLSSISSLPSQKYVTKWEEENKQFSSRVGVEWRDEKNSVCEDNQNGSGQNLRSWIFDTFEV